LGLNGINPVREMIENEIVGTEEAFEGIDGEDTSVLLFVRFGMRKISFCSPLPSTNDKSFSVKLTTDNFRRKAADGDKGSGIGAEGGTKDELL
jgi:hypothetical protein